MPRTPLPPLPPALTDRWVALRPQQPADRAFLRALYGSQRAAELAFAPWPAAAKAAFLDDQFRLQSAHFRRNHARADLLIVFRAQPPTALQPIGRLYLDRSRADWRLMEIALLPAEQGAGLGGALIAWMQAAACAAGAAGIGLTVTYDNPRAAALYTRFGFDVAAGATATHQPMRWTAPRAAASA